MTLAARLHDLADTVDELPGAEREAVARALARFERDRHIRAAARLANGCAGLLEALARDGWRVELWARRNRAPALADPVLVALFHARLAGPLPCERQIRRIVGHVMSQSLGEALR